MEQLKFSIKINSPKAKVWQVMLNDETYRIWSEIFHPCSYYKGSWDEGSRIDFLGPTENGEMGMITRIKANRKEEHISIEFLGMYINGEEDHSSSTISSKYFSFEEVFDDGQMREGEVEPIQKGQITEQVL